MDDSSCSFLDDVNIHPSLDDSSHPKLDDVSIHPILDDSSHLKMDDVNNHPHLDDCSHPFLDVVMLSSTFGGFQSSTIGDQVTAERAQNMQKVWDNSDTASHGMDGLVPVSEDWHSKMCLYKV